MASLLLGVAGSALGDTLFGGIGFLGASISGAQLGGALGAGLGSAIDAALTPGRQIVRAGARLSDTAIQASQEGAPITRLYGRMRLSGQIIWASRFKETATTTKTQNGGKGAPSVTVTQTDYTYSISFAVGLCAGPATRLGRVWANGNLLDLSRTTLRFHGGAEDQTPDPLIADIDGDVPAYRGLCHVVFEDMALEAFGNRIPQLQFEVFCDTGHDNPDCLEQRLTGVQLIPGAGEFVYATAPVFNDGGEGASTALNVHGVSGAADLEASLDDLQAGAPNLASVALVVGWFGDDLRAGQIVIRPCVESADKQTYPESWSVNGISREGAAIVSQVDGKPAYGGTPSDASVVAAIQTLKARGLAVLFNPFLFMDVAAASGLPDPYGAGAGQPAYPWRGRITCDPAAGVSGSPDKTAAATAQVAHFFGTASAGDFTVSGTNVAWSGGADWGWRRMILHYAHLCAAAGGVDAFLIGSELRGITRVRDGAVSYPAVAMLKTLAADVRAILGAGVKIGYGADWSEYNGHQTGDAPGAFLFNLDPLWADANIDFIGIDNYLPLADWRDGTAHLDAAIAPSTYDAGYLKGNIRGGEGYDFYYASDAARDGQTRTPITDGLGKPWLWRPKDLWNWWGNTHYDRADGSESATPTAWTAGSKPIWFTELGCPAIDKGANQPNLFVDPKSSESGMPYFSAGTRDDLIQRRFLEAHYAFWNDGANNPVSALTGAPMVDVNRIHVWCWDGRPFPYFPARADVWGDSANYTFGHWLNGRLGTVALGDLVTRVCAGAGFTACDTAGLDGIVTGFCTTDTISARDAIAPLATAFSFDAVERDGLLHFIMRGRGVPQDFTLDDLVLPEKSAGLSLTRAQESDLPQASRITYIDADMDYRQASVEARRLMGASNRVATSGLPLVMDQGQATAIGARLLQDAWVMRESAGFALPPSALALDVGDEVTVTAGGRGHRLRLTSLTDGAARAAEAVATDPSLYDRYGGPARSSSSVFAGQGPARPGRVLLLFLDLPWLKDGQNTAAPFLGACAYPWPGNVAVMRSASGSGYALDATLTRPCSFGATTHDFYSGPRWHWDRVNALQVKMTHGTLASADRAAVYGGANALAVQNPDGGWEVVQFTDAVLTGPGEYTLTNLLRGRRGSEGQMRDPVPAGARVVVLDDTLVQPALSPGQARQSFHYLWGPVSRPISDISWQSAARTFTGAGQIPLAPCHLAFTWQGGDLLLSWRRRDRAPDAVSIVPAQTALSETRLGFDLEICDASGAVVRTVPGLEAASYIYSAAQRAADFPGGLPNPLTIAVYQLSSLVGRGHKAKEALYVG